MDDGLRELGGVLFLASEYPHTGQKLRTGYWEATSGVQAGMCAPMGVSKKPLSPIILSNQAAYTSSVLRYFFWVGDIDKLKPR